MQEACDYSSIRPRVCAYQRVCVCVWWGEGIGVMLQHAAWLDAVDASCRRHFCVLMSYFVVLHDLRLRLRTFLPGGWVGSKL